MYHSLIINGVNTYREWGLIPLSRPHVAPPKPKTTYIDLPASDGQLDYSDVLTGRVPYGQREGSWEFRLRPGRKWAEVYSSILNFLHGQLVEVALEDDPLWCYTGRLEVNDWKSDPDYSVIMIDYNLDPYKKTLIPTGSNDWLWDDLFDLTIKYGTFLVEGVKYRNLINDGLYPITPTYTCSSPMEVELSDGETINLITGLNRNDNLALKRGDNYMIFKGNGTVAVDYREVSL